MQVLRILLISTLSLSVLPAYANNPSGKTCAKSGEITKFSNFEFQCKKSGKKLLWVKIGPIKKASTSGQKTAPTYLSSRDAVRGGLCQKLGQESFPMSGPLRCVQGKWTLINKAEDSVATRAFRYLLEKYNNNPPAKLTFKFITDPKFTGSIKIIQGSKEAGARLWNKVDTPFQPYPIVIGSNLDWIKQVAKSNNLSTNTGDFKNIENQFAEWNGCSYAEFYSQTGQPWYLYCYSQSEQTLNEFSGFLQVGAHEYTHLIQFFIADSQLKRFGDALPPWLQEGYAMFAGVSLGAAAGAGNDVRALELSGLERVKTPLSDYTERFPPNWSDVYVLGYLGVEALTAVKGLEIMEQLILEQKKGASKEDAFQKVTGNSLAIWTQIAQGYVDSVKAGKAWSLDELLKRTS